MESLTPLINGGLLAVFTFLLAWYGKGRFDRLETRVERVEAELAELRSMIMQIALAMGTQPKPQTG